MMFLSWYLVGCLSSFLGMIIGRYSSSYEYEVYNYEKERFEKRHSFIDYLKSGDWLHHIGFCIVWPAILIFVIIDFFPD